MRRVIATTNDTVPHSVFNKKNLHQLANFVSMPIYASFAQDMQVGVATHPIVVGTTLTTEVELNNLANFPIAAFSVGYIIEGLDTGISYGRVGLKCIGTVSDATIHD